MGKKVQRDGTERGHRSVRAFNSGPNTVLASPAPSSGISTHPRAQSRALRAQQAQLLGSDPICFARFRPEMGQLPGLRGEFQDAQHL